MTPGRGIFYIAMSALLGWVLAISVDMTGYELGALINYFWVPILMILAMMLYMIVCFISKHKPTRIVSLAILCFYLMPLIYW